MFREHATEYNSWLAFNQKEINNNNSNIDSICKQKGL